MARITTIGNPSERILGRLGGRKKRNTIPSYDRILAVNRANFSRHAQCWPFLATQRAILSKMKSIQLPALTSRAPGGQSVCIGMSMSCGSSKAEREKKRRRRRMKRGGNSEKNKVDIWSRGKSEKIDPSSKQAGRFASLGDCFGATVKYGINVPLHRGSRTVFPPPPPLSTLFFPPSCPNNVERSIFFPRVNLRRTFRCYWSKRGGVMRSVTRREKAGQ